MRRAHSILLGLSLCWPVAGFAQDMSWSTITPSITGTDTLGLHLRDQMQGAPRDRSGPQRAQQRPLTPPAPSAATGARLRYTPSKTRRTANLSAFVRKTRSVDQGNARDLERLFAAGDYIDRLGEVIAPLGLRVDDIADVQALWMISAWNASRGRNDTPSRAMAQAVRGQMAGALGATPGIIEASDAAKQELAEALLVQMTLIDVALTQNQKDAVSLRRLGVAVNQSARRMGVDLTAMELTEYGFVPASTGTVAPVPARPGAGAQQATARLVDHSPVKPR